MKPIATIPLLLASLCSLHTVLAQPVWERVTPIFGASVREVVINRTGDPVILTDQELRARFDSYWIRPTELLGSGGIPHGLMRSPSGWLYVCNGNNTRKSTDDGRTWNSSAHVSVDQSMVASADAIYAEGLQSNVLSRSTDEGGSWQQTEDPFGPGVAAYPSVSDNATTLFARHGQAKRIAFSTDQGRRWREINDAFNGEIISGASPGPSTHFITTWNPVQSENRLYRSTDNGATWQLVDTSSEPIQSIRALSDSIAYLIRGGRAYRSIDAGRSWNKVELSKCAEHPVVFTAIAIAPDQTVYLGTNSDGLLSSTDHGETWSEAGLFAPLMPGLSCVGGKVFTSILGRVWESSDEGRTWECARSYPHAIDSAGIWYRYGVERSTDKGVSWTAIVRPVPSGNYFQASDLVATPRGTLLCAFSRESLSTYSSGVMRWKNETTWTMPLEHVGGGQLGRLHLSPAGVIYYLSPDFYRSTDDGITWTRPDSPLTHHRLSIGGDETLYAITSTNNAAIAERSTDMGASWQQLSWSSDSLIDLMAVGKNGVMAILSNGTDQPRLIYSSDRGETIIEAADGLGSDRPIAFLCEAGGTAYLRTDSGIYRSQFPAAAPPVDGFSTPLSITAWPVPAYNELTVEIVGAGGKRVDLDIVGSDGATIYRVEQRVSSSGLIRIDVRSLPSGHYKAIARIDGRSVSTSVVILH